MWKMADGRWKMSRAMVRVSGSVPFQAEASEVFAHLARAALAHAVEPRLEEVILRKVTVLTQYETKIGPLTVVTTEEATLEPGSSITWRHVDGPLTGSVETLRLGASRGPRTVVLYEGEIRARNRLLRGPLEWLVVGPLTRMVSMKALKEASRGMGTERAGEQE